MLRNYFIFLIFIFSIQLCYCSSDMVFIQGGNYTPLFKFGDDALDEFVEVKSFYIDKYHVTNKDFHNFVLRNPKWSVEQISSIFADRGYLSHWNDVDFNLVADHPVVNVSWFAASAYCSYFNKRLPSVDEWEYVGSASNKSRIGKDEVGYLQDILDWYLNSQFKVLSGVKQMDCNYWGVCGLHGYIWEMVENFNSVILLNTDAEGGGLEEVLYCGATATTAVDPADYVAFMRFAFRNSLEANYTMSHLGFRCVEDEKV